jgi:segregation and condensation protein B
VIGSLKEKGLVREVGRERDRSRAMQYGTTRRFLETFGLRSLRDLPPLEDFAPDEESKRFIRERLSGSAISSTLEEATADIEEEQELLGDAFAGDEAPGSSEEDADGAAADREGEAER